ncbi:MAG: malate dehydrogenase [Candidatus Geothermincolia bacterium]
MAKVAVIGAGQVGALTAMRVCESGLAEVALIDVQPGIARGKALDIAQASALAPGALRIEGGESMELAAGCDVAVVTAGFPRTQGMDRLDLLRKNAAVVSEVVSDLAARAPGCIILMVTNPLDEMAYLAWRVSGFEPHRVLGMAGVLDAARFRYFAGRSLGVPAWSVEAQVLGMHGEGMVPLSRMASAGGISVSSLLPADSVAEIERQTIDGGAEIVSLLRSGSAFFAPSASVAAMVASILRDERRVLPASALLQGQYGMDGIYLGVPARLGSRGVIEVVEFELEAAERQALEAAGTAVRARIEELRLG